MLRCVFCVFDIEVAFNTSYLWKKKVDNLAKNDILVKIWSIVWNISKRRSENNFDLVMINATQTLKLVHTHQHPTTHLYSNYEVNWQKEWSNLLTENEFEDDHSHTQKQKPLANTTRMKQLTQFNNIIT